MMEYICVGITFKLIKDRSKVNDTKHGEICIVTFFIDFVVGQVITFITWSPITAVTCCREKDGISGFSCNFITTFPHFLVVGPSPTAGLY